MPHATHGARRQTGFTLVELVIVILILGILSAVALPRFINLGRDASLATLSGTEGAVRGGMALARTKCLLTTGCNASGVTSPSIEGATHTFVHGYPNGGELTMNSIERWVELSGVTAVQVDNFVTRFQIARASAPATCYVQYVEVGAWGGTPTITTVDTGC